MGQSVFETHRPNLKCEVVQTTKETKIKEGVIVRVIANSRVIVRHADGTCGEYGADVVRPRETEKIKAFVDIGADGRVVYHISFPGPNGEEIDVTNDEAAQETYELKMMEYSGEGDIETHSYPYVDYFLKQLADIRGFKLEKK